MANVFISHRGNDLTDAERLAAELKSLGHLVWLDKWEIDLGDSIVAKMNEGLEGASFLILCYSSSGVMSPWVSREWMSALARQMNGAGVKVLPVVLSGGQPPAIMADVKYTDLTSDWASGVSAICNALGAP